MKKNAKKQKIATKQKQKEKQAQNELEDLGILKSLREKDRILSLLSIFSHLFFSERKGKESLVKAFC